MQTYKYQAFGLNISSEFELPELVAGSYEPDVIIKKGEILGVTENFDISPKIYSATCDEVVYGIKGIGWCKISKGRDVLIQADLRATSGGIRLFILTSVLGVVFLQRGMFPVHGSAIILDGKCIILTGDSGAGKSTLASAMMDRGALFLADDVSIISIDNEGRVWVQPAYPYRKLFKETAEAFKINVEKLEQVEDERGKFLIPVTEKYRDTPARLDALVLITPSECGEVSIQALKGMEKLQTVMNNICRWGLIPYLKIEKQYFQKSVFVAENITAYKLERPDGQFTVDDQITFLCKKLALHSRVQLKEQ